MTASNAGFRSTDASGLRRSTPCSSFCSCSAAASRPTHPVSSRRFRTGTRPRRSSRVASGSGSWASTTRLPWKARGAVRARDQRDLDGRARRLNGRPWPCRRAVLDCWLSEVGAGCGVDRRTDLLCEAEVVAVVPDFDNLSVLEPEDVDAREGHPAPGRFDRAPVTAVSA